MAAVICFRGATWRLFPCKLWTGATANGYGHRRSNGKLVLVHREGLERFLGRPLRDGLLACHHCDVRNCYQQMHLYEGTHADNNADCLERGRWRGHPERPRIPDSARAEIIRRYVEDGASLKIVAREFGIAVTSVARIVPKDQHHRPGTRPYDGRLAEEVRQRYAAGGITQPQLIAEYGLSAGTVNRMVRGIWARPWYEPGRSQGSHGPVVVR